METGGHKIGRISRPFPSISIAFTPDSPWTNRGTSINLTFILSTSFLPAMVQLDVVRSCNSTLIKTQPLVAIFVGGTSGIGEHTIRALAVTHSDKGKGLRLYIVGRNADAAKKIISDCVRVCPGGQFQFVQAGDLALLRDVDHVCAEIIRIEEHENANGARVDLLVMSQAFFNPFEPRRGISSSLVPLCPSVPPQAT